MSYTSDCDVLMGHVDNAAHPAEDSSDVDEDHDPQVEDSILVDDRDLRTRLWGQRQ